MAAPVTDYISFNAQLNRQVGQDSDTEVAATIGRKLTICGAWGEETFSKSGAHVPAEIGAVMAHMTGLGNKVDWSTAVWDVRRGTALIPGPGRCSSCSLANLGTP